MVLWLALAAGDYTTSAELAFTPCYLAPIGITVWWLGVGAGIAMSTACTASFAVGLFVARGAERAPASTTTLVLNIGGALGVFLTMAILASRLHQRLDSETNERFSPYRPFVTPTA
jgi:hypothetical protein